MSALRLLFTLALGLLPAAAAEVADLGQELGYLRIRDLDAEPFSSPASTLVVDLRQASANSAAGIGRLRGLLASTGGRFVLISDLTAPAIVSALEPRGAHVLTFGGTDAPPTDIRISVHAPEDRRAYEALDHGASLAELANPPLVKTRRDEASILRGRRSGSSATDARPSPGPGPRDPAAPASADVTAAPSPGDPVLQRAVQVHRGLRALRRL